MYGKITYINKSCVVKNLVFTIWHFCSFKYRKEQQRNMPKLTYDEELEEIIDPLLLDNPDVYPGRVFGMPGYYIEGKLCASIFESGLVLKLPEERCKELIENKDGFDFFAPLGNIMRKWVHITKDDPDSYEEEIDLINESILFVREEALKGK